MIESRLRMPWSHAPIRRCVLALLVAATPMMFSACTEPGEPGADLAVGDTAGPDVGVTVAEIMANPDAYLNKVVTVSGEINDVIGPRFFTIGGEEFGGAEMPIITTTDVPAIPNRPENEYLVDDDIVQATGTVRMFVVTEIEEEAGLDLDDVQAEAWVSKPVLVVNNLAVTPRVLAPGTAPATVPPVTDTTP